MNKEQNSKVETNQTNFIGEGLLVPIQGNTTEPKKSEVPNDSAYYL